MADSIQTTKYEFNPIQMMHKINVSGYMRRYVFGFGMVNVSMNLMGHV